VIGARWNEMKLGEKIWTIPAARMKAEKEHRVPLSDRALEILRALKTQIGDDPDGFIFPGSKHGKALSNMAMDMLLRRMKRDVTVHGFRSTFRDWAAERTNYPSEVVEMALAHTISSKIEKAYRRGDLFERRCRLMSDWATFARTPQAEMRDNVAQLQS
jgi:integrase